MAAISSILMGIGIAVSAAGSFMAANAQAEASQKQADIAKQQEAVRQQQMNLDSMRRKRDLIRQSQLAAAQAQATAGAQGASNSSGLEGALSGITNKEGGAQLANNQNVELGTQMFALNAKMAQAYADGSSAQAFASGLGSLGGALTKSSGMIGQVGSYALS